MKPIKRYIAAVSVVAVVVAGTIIASAVSAAATSAGDVKSGSATGAVNAAISTVGASLGTDRVASVTQQGSQLIVTITGSDQASRTVASWYGDVFARAVADQVEKEGGSPVLLVAQLDASGNSVTGGSERVRPILQTEPLTEGACASDGAAATANAKVKVLQADNVDVLNGGCSFVVTPTIGVAEFVKNAGQYLDPIVKAIPDSEGHPYLIQVQDDKGATQLILGWIPGIGGDNGEGIAWVPPNTDSSAVVGFGSASGSAS
jgi:hypothetical protein